jgi:uncharacterized SAM-dependent methyltransferase
MRFLKNGELIRRYGVSDKTVRNWIAASLTGKLDLKVVEDRDKHYIADTVGNDQMLKKLTVKGRKYRNGRTYKVVSPKDEFYELYSLPQIIDIANLLEKEKELSWDYSYFGEAAAYWNQYLNEMYAAGEGNLLTNTIETFKFSYPYVDAITSHYDHINVVNICIGNNLVAKDIIAHIKNQGKLNRCIALDLSPDILDVAEKNTDKWFDNEVKLEKYVVDVRYQWFGDILAHNPKVMDAGSVMNLVLFIGGPIVCFKWPEQVLHTIHDSLGANDLLFTSQKRDTNEARDFFDFNVKSDTTLTGFRRNIMAHLLSIEPNFYTLEQAFDPQLRMRYMQLRLNVSVAVKFETETFTKTVELEKGDALFLWRSWQYSDEQILGKLRESDFSVLQTIQSKDKQLLATISKVKDIQDLCQ